MDDTNLMGMTKVREATNLHKALDIYLVTFDQKINEGNSI
jgi:hypothetical protein